MESNALAMPSVHDVGALAVERHASLKEVIRLRWIAIAAQAATITVVAIIWGASLPMVPLFAILLVAAATNVVLPRLKGYESTRLIGGIMVVDVIHLTGLLALTGGPANPFSVLYLIHVMLAAIVTGPRWTWLVVATSSAGFGLLFFASIPLPAELGGHGHMAAHGGHRSFSVHLQGMWLAYTLAAATIAAFVSKLATKLRHEREERARSAHLLGLATIAAGAAHEIGNPLATIRVAASELERDLSARGLPADILDDLKLINAEVSRAHEVLNQMAVGAGELVGECPVVAHPRDLLAKTVGQLGPIGLRVCIEQEGDVPEVRWPVRATAQAMTQLIRNGLQASPDESYVRCCVSGESGGVTICVTDEGVGMNSHVLSRLGEPFFTTRTRGMGLGVFIARSLIEHLGGRIQVWSLEGKGTSVHVWLPSGETG